MYGKGAMSDLEINENSKRLVHYQLSYVRGLFVFFTVAFHVGFYLEQEERGSELR